jgi:hypothetical protein
VNSLLSFRKVDQPVVEFAAALSTVFFSASPLTRFLCCRNLRLIRHSSSSAMPCGYRSRFGISKFSRNGIRPLSSLSVSLLSMADKEFDVRSHLTIMNGTSAASRSFLATLHSHVCGIRELGDGESTSPRFAVGALLEGFVTIGEEGQAGTRELKSARSRFWRAGLRVVASSAARMQASAIRPSMLLWTEQKRRRTIGD